MVSTNIALELGNFECRPYIPCSDVLSLRKSGAFDSQIRRKNIKVDQNGQATKPTAHVIPVVN